MRPNPAPPQNVIDFGELAPAESELRLVVESSVFNQWQPSGGLEACMSMPLLCGMWVLLSLTPPMVQVMVTLRCEQHAARDLLQVQPWTSTQCSRESALASATKKCELNTSCS